MVTKAEAQVTHLVAEIEKFEARQAAAISQGNSARLIKRELTRLESEVVIARRRAAEELHALPTAVLGSQG